MCFELQLCLLFSETAPLPTSWIIECQPRLVDNSALGSRRVAARRGYKKARQG